MTQYPFPPYILIFAMHISDPEALAQQLALHPDYRILRRLALPNPLGNDLGQPLARGMVIDTETTGLSPQQDCLIELGLLLFDYDPITGQPIHLVSSYQSFDNPGYPIPAEITALTGITDEMVAGKTLDVTKLQKLLTGVSVVIAHNAAFDRPFLEKRLPFFREVPWGCSLQDIPWKQEGISSKKLDYIACQLGFFFDGHRAIEDCQALLRILSLPLPRSSTHGLQHILAKQADTSFVVYASGAPFSRKDELKARRYRWNPERKVWSLEVLGNPAFEAEKLWLSQIIYDGRSAFIDVEIRDAIHRYSSVAVPCQRIAL